MNVITVGVIDYGMGNHGSVVHTLREIGFRVRVSREPQVLDQMDALILPGVGAYPAAIRELHTRGLLPYLQEQARRQRPLLGICLGMQLLASASHEHGYTAGLDIIPGEFIPFADKGGHIGWNTIECVIPDAALKPSDGQAFYFNHSFHYQGPNEFQVAVTRHPENFASVIRRGNAVGLQFHPEKSQTAGTALLKNLIQELVHA